MLYKNDFSYAFKVLPASANDDYFHLSVEDKNGRPSVSRLSKLQFQKSPDYSLPSTLNCRVKGFNEDGTPVLAHIVAPYIYELYKALTARNGTFTAEVVSVPSKPEEEPYLLRDSNGIFYPFRSPDGLLAKGQPVHLKFVRLTPRNFIIERVNEAAHLPFYSVDNIIAGSEMPPAVATLVRRILYTGPELEGIREEIRADNALWPVNAARVVLNALPSWFLSSADSKLHRTVKCLLDAFRNCLLYLLERSGYLNMVSEDQRSAFRARLTEMVESIEPYDNTLLVMSSAQEDAFVESLLDKLHRSGYLFHPARQFSMLMLIFRMHPDKVGYYLNRIFESIFSRDLENWKKEPFRSAFVEQFKIYVGQARAELDALPLAENREQKSRLETIITAIALQLILGGDYPARSHTESLFFRYVSLLRPLNTEHLLSKSFLSLMGADFTTRLDYEELKEPMMMMTRATVMPAGDFMQLIKETHLYSNGHVDIAVSSDGIVISQTHRQGIADRVIPEGLMGWLKPQIHLSGVRNLSGQKLKKLDEHNLWWHEIETGLLDRVAPERETGVAPAPKRRKAQVGDEVYIVINEVDDFFDNNPTFRCRISDGEFEDGEGTMRRDQIVGYNLKQPPIHCFRADDGSQLGFLATVTAIDNDGSYCFSLRDEVDRYIEDSFNFDDEYTAIIAGTSGRDYSAITRLGIGLFLEKDPEASFRVGDIVACRFTQKGKQGQLRAYITKRLTAAEDKFDKSEAFSRLMKAIGESEVVEETENEPKESVIRDYDEMLLPDDIREIAAIIRLRAIAETDLIKAYDYLRFARILALIIGDQILADSLGTHAALLTLHQYYATNSRIDPDKLEALRISAQSDPLLRMIYHRLEMVSWLGHNEHDAELYATAANPANKLEGSIARMVLSYNMLTSSDDNGDNAIASDIKQQIMHKLNVNNEAMKRKYYGSESKYLEFKTSIVYPAVAPGSEMREDPEEQQFHIMSRIAGLLNADGGRLYIGVNNDGYEVGLHDDFKYYERRNATVGHYTARIRNIDNMCVFLENLINETFGVTTARKIDVSVDAEAEKGVILFDVRRSLDPVLLDGRLFVRQSGQSTREYKGTDIDDFVKERAELRAERDHLNQPAN